MPARGLGRSSLLALLLGVLLVSCSTDLDDLMGGRKEAGAREASSGAEAGSGAAGAGLADGSSTTGGAGSAATGGVAGSAGSGGSDWDAGAGGNGGEGGFGGFSGMGGVAGAAGTSGGGAADAMAGASGMDGSGGIGGTAGSGGQSGSAGSGAAGTSGAGGTEAGTDTIIVRDAGSSDAPIDQTTSNDAALLCQGGVCKRVFVSSTPPPGAGNLGGLAGADAFCQSAANTKQLGGTWKAWLSDATTSASLRLTHATVPYVLLEGPTIAANWNALTNGTLDHAINVSEDGTVHTAILEVWTATTLRGAYSGRSCNAWTTNASGSIYADVGLSNQTDGGWTDRFPQFCDRLNVHLYCFEQ